MMNKSGNMNQFWCVFLIFISSILLLLSNCGVVNGGLNFHEDSGVSSGSTGTIGRLVKKEERIPVVATEFGEISAVDVDDGSGTGRHSYHIQFITLEPNALFLPVLLHADMVFYVKTGSGKISWTDSDELKKVDLQRGDVYRLKSGSLFYLHSNLEAEETRLRIVAVFANPKEDKVQGPLIGPYSSINDLVRGFDKSILQAAFQVPEEVVEELTSATDTPAIVHAETKKKNFWHQELLFINVFLGVRSYSNQISENKKKHSKTFNFFKEDPDFKSCSGWSTAVTDHNLHALQGSHIGVYMVNLTKGSTMGPHWNPMATEVSVVLEGEGMVRVVCPSALTNKECKNSRFKIEEGDVFTVPRFHPMAQSSFNNGSLVFMGFSSTTKKNHPQFLAGKASVLQTLSKTIIGASFNVSNTTIDQLLAAQEEAIILDCTSCAEEQEMKMEDEIEKERQEEEERTRREEEKERKKEEEKERKRREKEEKRRKREEEERKRQEEEQKRQEEEEERRKREEEEEQRRQEEEEEKREREEEEQKRQEEEEQRRKEEEEEKREKEEEEKRKKEEEEQKRQEEEEQKRHEEEEEKRKREEEEQKRQEEEEQRKQEEEEEKRKRKEEEERRREEEERERQEEEEQRRQEEEEEKRKRKEEEEQRKREKEEDKKRREQEEEQRRQEEEEEKQREEEEQRRQEKEEEQRKQEEQRREEEKKRQREEEKQRKKEEKERQREEEKQRKREEEEQRRREEEGGEEEQETEQEIARREEEERREWERQAEKEARKKREREGSDGSGGEGRRILKRTTKVSDVRW
ncbi:vicilin-like seed storage protein At2g18540 [Chenopodium quinoa]|uniref:vicilin-like seed storage protein At2g18540 n=1 Tax=Chenopodium quinoa TaxID=63459 RepID=UPI000B7714BB|nr:vicilin-like seed storage protein At2g18540 [Chenopodium quinoa]